MERGWGWELRILSIAIPKHETMIDMQRIGRIFFFNQFGVIAFVTGFVLMAYEMVASRILAPSIGTSTYIWTSVIGIIIAALAIGYALGGWLADRRSNHMDLVWLLIACAAAIAGTLIAYPSVMALVASLFTDLRIQALFDVGLLFMPASFLMGVISPYLARLSIHSVSTTGRTVASLSALNSIGGISGTFCTGFILFSTIGSRETLVLLVTLLLATAWLIAPRQLTWVRLATSASIAGAAWLVMAPPFQANTVAVIDTPSAHYTILEGIGGSSTVRALSSGPSGLQSIVDMAEPDKLASQYTQTIADIAAQAPAKQSILVLGGGAFVLPEHFGRTYPQATIDVVEIDGALETVAQRYLDYDPLPNVRTHTQDARTFLNRTNTTYDIIVVDVYNDTSVPFSLATSEYAGALAAAISEHGTVVVNMIAADNNACRPLLSRLHGTYRSALPHGNLVRTGSTPSDRKQNIIGVYTLKPNTWLSPPLSQFDATLDPATPLSDNFAPVEALQQACI